jgi:type IV pilus assembly protein PilN
MARINLLPWREELRRERQREFLSLGAGALVLTAAVMGYVHLHIAATIDNQQSRNNFLQSEIRNVDKKIAEIKELEKKKEQLIARMRVIEQLQRNRPEIVHLFDELVKLTPDGLYFTSLTQKGSELSIEGKAQSNARVSALIRNLAGSKWFAQPDLKVIQNRDKKEDQLRKFTVVVKQSSGDKPESEEK